MYWALLSICIKQKFSRVRLFSFTIAYRDVFLLQRQNMKYKNKLRMSREKHGKMLYTYKRDIL